MLRFLILKVLHHFNWHHMIEPERMMNDWLYGHIPAQYRTCSWRGCNFKIWIDNHGRQIVTKEGQTGPAGGEKFWTPPSRRHE
jgi:hypothetical protein